MSSGYNEMGRSWNESNVMAGRLRLQRQSEGSVRGNRGGGSDHEQHRGGLQGASQATSQERLRTNPLATSRADSQGVYQAAHQGDHPGNHLLSGRDYRQRSRLQDAQGSSSYSDSLHYQPGLLNAVQTGQFQGAQGSGDHSGYLNPQPDSQRRSQGSYQANQLQVSQGNGGYSTPYVPPHQAPRTYVRGITNDHHVAPFMPYNNLETSSTYGTGIGGTIQYPVTPYQQQPLQAVAQSIRPYQQETFQSTAQPVPHHQEQQSYQAPAQPYTHSAPTFGVSANPAMLDFAQAYDQEVTANYLLPDFLRRGPRALACRAFDRVHHRYISAPPGLPASLTSTNQLGSPIDMQSAQGYGHVFGQL